MIPELRRHSVGHGVVILLASASLTLAQNQSSINPTTGSAATRSSAPTADSKPPMKREEIDALVAPIALYPDSVLSQILMATTYPLEVVQAARWTKANKIAKGDALTAALEKESWDASVKSLVNFPDVLAMMDEKIDWTIKLGDAFIGQQKEVMDAVQRLRSKAKSAGNLKDTAEQKVIVEKVPATQTTVVQVPAAQSEVIVIQPTNPEVVYVPQYNPTVVYGTWAYPSYPPYPVYPPGYVAGTAAISFGVGMAVGAAWGYAWGGCNWNGGDVNIDVDRNTEINNNIDRSKYKSEIDRSNRGSREGKGSFQHNAAHRDGVPYRDKATAGRFEGNTAGGLSSRQAEQARQQYRGRTNSAGTSDLSSRGASAAPQKNYSGDLSRSRPDQSSPAAARGANSGQSPQSSGGTRSGQSSAVSGSNRSGNSTRADSQRGQASRSSGSGARPSGGGSSSGGASRSGGALRSGGGGASRGGGGGGARGGGGGRR